MVHNTCKTSKFCAVESGITSGSFDVVALKVVLVESVLLCACKPVFSVYLVAM